MDINNLSLDSMEMYSHGKMNFMVGLCEQLRLPEIFNRNLQKNSGRKTDIPYGVMAEMMIVNICDDHSPLYRFNIPVGDFHYIADSALLTSDNLKKAECRNLKLITRMPESTNFAKGCIREALIKKDLMKKIELKTAKDKVVESFISEKDCTYEDTDLKCVICYSTTLEGVKKRTIERQIKKKKEAVEKISKSYSKRPFACEDDANKEILKLVNNKK